MGMAASQGRLLALTARLHDVEYKAQRLQGEKIALATQRDEVYQKYCDALDAKVITVAYEADVTGATVDIPATFTSVCEYNPSRRMDYVITDTRTGKVIVDNNVKTMYETYSNDKYAFAFAAMGYNTEYGWTENQPGERAAQGEYIGVGKSENIYYIGDTALGEYNNGGYGTGVDGFMTEAEGVVYELHKSEDSKLASLYNSMFESNMGEMTRSDKQSAIAAFRDYLYSHYQSEIFLATTFNKNTATIDNLLYDPSNPADAAEAVANMGDYIAENIGDADNMQFNYYLKLFDAIKEAGGCQEIDAAVKDGDDGATWFQNMIKAGLISIQMSDRVNNKWSVTNLATSANVNCLQEKTDTNAAKKADAEYEHALKIINTKDTRFDTELSKLETERTAITQEMDSIKKVRDDNEQRTFGIFS